MLFIGGNTIIGVVVYGELIDIYIFVFFVCYLDPSVSSKHVHAMCTYPSRNVAKTDCFIKIRP